MTQPPVEERRGAVVEFDRHVGLGTVECSDGSRLMFHCAEIVDGSRDIAIGAEVTFSVLRKFSRDEAGRVTPR